MVVGQALLSRRVSFMDIYRVGAWKSSVRYAIVAASLKVACAGLQMAPVIQIQELARKIRVEVTSW